MNIIGEDYKEAKRCLKRYNRNKLNILIITTNIMDITGVSYDGMPKAPYTNGDTVLKSVVRLSENKELQTCKREVNAVDLAVKMVDTDSKIIFEHLYDKQDMNSNAIMWEYSISEPTFKRKHSKLVRAVAEELKKMILN